MDFSHSFFWGEEKNEKGLKVQRKDQICSSLLQRVEDWSQLSGSKMLFENSNNDMSNFKVTGGLEVNSGFRSARFF